MYSKDLADDIAFSAANDNSPEMDEVAKYFDCQFEDFNFEADIDYDEIGQAMIALASKIDKDKTDALRAKSTIDNPSEDYDEDAVSAFLRDLRDMIVASKEDASYIAEMILVEVCGEVEWWAIAS